MGKPFKSAGAFIIVLMLVATVLVFVFDYIPVWLFAVLFDVICIFVVSLLFSYADHIESNDRQFRTLKLDVEKVQDEDRTEIISKDDLKHVSINGQSMAALSIKRGMLNFGEYTTSLVNINRAELNQGYLEITVFDRTFYFSFNEKTQKEAENICELLNSIINKK